MSELRANADQWFAELAGPLQQFPLPPDAPVGLGDPQVAPPAAAPIPVEQESVAAPPAVMSEIQGPAVAPPLPPQHPNLQPVINGTDNGPMPGPMADPHPLFINPTADEDEQMRTLAENANANLANNAALAQAQQQNVADQGTIDQELANAGQPLLDEKAQVAAESADRIQAFNAEYKRRVDASFDRWEKWNDLLQDEATKNPGDLWGNASNSQRVGTIIGAIAAGFSGGGQRYIDSMVNRAVQAHQNRMAVLGAGIESANRQVNAASRVLSDEASGDKILTAALYENINKRLEAMKNRFADPAIRARVEKEQLGIQAKAQEVNRQIVKDYGAAVLNRLSTDVRNQLAMGRMDLYRQGLELRKEGQALRLHDDERKDKQFDDREAAKMIPGYSLPFRDDQARRTFITKATPINGLIKYNNEALDLVDSFKKQPSRANLERLNNFLLGSYMKAHTDARNASGSGAALNEKENAILERSVMPLQDILKKLAVGSTTGIYDVEEMIKEGRRAWVEDLAERAEMLGSRQDKSYHLFAPTYSATDTRAKAQKQLELLRAKRGR